MTFTLESLLMDDDFRHWVANPDAERSQSWQVRLANASDEQRDIIRQARLVLLSLPAEETLSDQAAAQLWATIQRRHQASDTAAPVSTVRQIGSRSIWYRVAASVAVVSLVGWLGWRTYAERTISVHTPYGQNKQISLPDGSLVTLNGNSTLSYPANWTGKASREVSLEGEAYFRVTKQQRNQHPVKFTVHLEKLNIEVLGTQFNVKNRQQDVNIVLDEGKVQISQLTANGTSTRVLMKPGDVVRFSRTQKLTYHRQVAHPEQYSAWTQNALIFSNTPLQTIAQTLKDTYGLTVTFADPSLADLTFTGNMPADNPSLVLETLAKAFDLQIQHTDATHVILNAN